MRGEGCCRHYLLEDLAVSGACLAHAESLELFRDLPHDRNGIQLAFDCILITMHEMLHCQRK